MAPILGTAGRVLERRRERARLREVPPERLFATDQPVAVELGAGPVVTGHDARHTLVRLDRSSSPDGDRVAHLERTAGLDGDPARAHLNAFGELANPGQREDEVAAHAPEEDGCERVALGVVSALVDMQTETPR